jgi:hypothetical protein
MLPNDAKTLVLIGHQAPGGGAGDLFILFHANYSVRFSQGQSQ